MFYKRKQPTERIAAFQIPYLLLLTLSLAVCPALGVDSWRSEPVGQTVGKVDHETGLPVIDEYGRREFVVARDFRPSILVLNGTIRFLRTHTFNLDDPPETDPDSGFPVLGDFLEIEYAVLDQTDRWTFSTPLLPRSENVRAPLIVPAGEDGFAVFHLRNEDLVMDRFADGEVERFELPLAADRVEVAFDDFKRAHITWTADSGLWYGSYDGTEWAPVLLSEEKPDSFRIAAGTGRVHLIYTGRAGGDNTNGDAGNLFYRGIQDGSPGPEEPIYSSDTRIEHIDLILGFEENPLACFVNPENFDVVLASRVGDDWEIESRSIGRPDTGPLAISPGPDGEPYVALIADEGREIWYGRFFGNDFEQVSVSEYARFHFGIDLALRDDGTPVILSAEQDRLFLKWHSPKPSPPVFQPTRQALEITSDHHLHWYAGDGAFTLRRLESSTDLSYWPDESTAHSETIFDDAGMRMFRMPAGAGPQAKFFRAVYRDLRDD